MDLRKKLLRRITCEAFVSNRAQNEDYGSRKHLRSSSILLDYHQKETNSELQFILIMSPKKEMRTYKIKNNIRKIHSKFISSGKVTISFWKPEHDVYITADPTTLRSFMNSLNLILDEKTGTIPKMDTRKSQKYQKKLASTETLVVMTRKDLTKTFSPNLKVVKMNGMFCETIDSRILNLKFLTRLDLACNEITDIPEALGELPLVNLDLSSNRIGENDHIKKWNWLNGKVIRKTLSSLDLSNNTLDYFPYKIVRLEKLHTLDLSINYITNLPFAIRRLKMLNTLKVQKNKLQSLPFTITTLRLKKLDISYNTFRQVPHYIEMFNNKQNMPTLLELAARTIMKNKISYLEENIPETLIDYISEMPLCICNKLCSSNNKSLRTKNIMDTISLSIVVSAVTQFIYFDVILCSEECKRRLSGSYEDSD